MAQSQKKLEGEIDNLKALKMSQLKNVAGSKEWNKFAVLIKKKREYIQKTWGTDANND